MAISHCSYSQLSTSHWISPIHSRDPNQVNDHYVYLSTPEPIPFQVTVTDGAGNPLPGSPATISRGNPASLLIGNQQPSVMFLEPFELNTVQSNKGLLLDGSSPFYVSFRVRSNAQAGYLTSKGKLGAGTSFRLGSMPQQADQGLRNFYASVMATEDNTSITFSDYDPAVEFTTGTTTISPNTITITLNEGQTYTVSGYTNVVANLDGFVGALVNSDKPITVNTGNAMGSLSPNSGQDFGIDQIAPISIVGQEYIAIEGAGNPSHERPIVIATQNNTEIFINGSTTSIATINAGEYYLVNNSYYRGTGHRNMYIHASSPVYVYQGLAGNTDNTTPGMNFLPPLNCLLLTEVDLISSVDKIGNTSYSGDIIATTLTGATLSINGSPTSAIPESVMGNPNWVTYRIHGLSGNIKVSSTQPLSVGLYGFNGVAGFAGYYSGFGFEGQLATVEVCEGKEPVNVLNEIPGNPLSGGIWTPSFSSGTDFFDPDIDSEGIYNYILANDCSVIDIDVEITITPSPTIGTISPIGLCDDASHNKIESFDFTASIIEALNGQDPDAFLVTFHKTFQDAENNVNNLGTIYTNTDPIETIFAKVTSNINYSCFEITDFTITVHTPIANAGTDTAITCADATITLDGGGSTGNGSLNYLWTTNNGNIISGENNVSPIVDEPGTYVLTITDTTNNCTDTNEIEVIANFSLPVANIPLDNIVCDNSNDGDDTNGSVLFNLRSNDLDILNGQAPTLTIDYFSNEIDAIGNSNPLPDNYRNLAPSQEIFVRIGNSHKTCYDIISFNLIVNALPQANNSILVQCDLDQGTATSSTDGITNFNLNQAYVNITGGIPDQTLFFYETLTDRANDNPIPDPIGYTNTSPFSQLIYVKVITPNNCERNSELTLEVQPTTQSLPVRLPQYACDTDAQDNIVEGVFDLETVRNSLYLGLETAFYTSISDASLELNEISGDAYLSSSRTVYVRIENSNQCQGVEQFELRINPSPKIFLEDTYIICDENPQITLSANPNSDTYIWYQIDKNGIETQLSHNDTVTLIQEGFYKLVLENKYSNGTTGQSCPNEKTIELITSNKATITHIEVKELSNNNSILIKTKGNGDYEYALDNGSYQDLNFFEHLLPKAYTVFVRDKKGCGEVSQKISILGFRKFFTPNGDSINDFWNILGTTRNSPKAAIFIYDRYGKLLTQIRSHQTGWDGCYKGKPLPGSDYWFLAKLEDGREFNGHFSLKR